MNTALIVTGVVGVMHQTGGSPYGWLVPVGLVVLIGVGIWRAEKKRN